MKRVSISLLLLVVALLVPTLAPAQGSGAAAAKMRQIHILAMENYDLGDYKAARDQLLSALDIAKKGKLEKEMVTAKTHLLLAGIYMLGFRDEAKAIEQYKGALTIAPGIKLEPPFDSEPLKKALAKADYELNPIITCDNLMGIEHKQVTRADEGLPVKVTFKAGPELREGTAHLSFRGNEEEEFTELDMKRAGKCGYIGRIPGTAVSGEMLHYFVSMKKKDGRLIAMRGNKKSPFPIMVVKSAKSPTTQNLETEAKDENPDELFGNKHRGGTCAGCATGLGTTGDLGLLALVVGTIAVFRRRKKHK